MQKINRESLSEEYCPRCNVKGIQTYMIRTLDFLDVKKGIDKIERYFFGADVCPLCDYSVEIRDDGYGIKPVEKYEVYKSKNRQLFSNKF